MWLLNWASGLYADGQKVVTEYPVVVFVWSGIVFLAGMVPQKWMLEKLRQVWPWDQVPLPVASAYMLGKIEGGLVADQVRREKKPTEMLVMMAQYVVNHSKVTAIMPPAPQRIGVHSEEFTRGVFVDGGDCFNYYGASEPKYTKFAVARWRLWLAVRNLKKAEENVFSKKGPLA